MNTRGTLFRTVRGDVDCTWIFCIALIATLCTMCIASIFPTVQIPAVAFGSIVGVYTTTLLAAIPINKARVLKDATLPGNVVKGLMQEFGGSTHAVDGAVTEADV